MWSKRNSFLHLTTLDPKKLIPIHTMHPDAFHEFSDKTELKDDGVTFEV